MRKEILIFLAIGIGACATGPIRKIAGTLSSPENVMILNSGSSNSPKWSLEIAPSGAAVLTVLESERSYQLSSSQTSKLFADLTTIKSIPFPEPEICVKSVSFGTTMVMSWQSWHSPDLSCPVGKSPQWQALVADFNDIEKSVKVSAAIFDIQHPLKQQPANLPHCVTPDGRYSVEVSAVYDHVHFFAMIEDLASIPYHGQAFDSYSINGTSPFLGVGSDRNSKAELFSLTLVNPNYDKDTDASLRATFIDQRTADDGSSLNATPTVISYDHINCTRWYR